MRSSFLFFTQSTVLSLCLLLSACGGNDSVTQVEQGEGPDIIIPGPPPENNFPIGAEVPDNRYVDSYKILIFGNSHVRSNNLPEIIRQLISAGMPDAGVELKLALGIRYLDERLQTTADLALLQSADWTHVILQGQKYSTSGLFSYPVTDTLTWLKAAKAQQTTPILFPEHGQADNAAEGKRVHELHQSIAETEPACIAPIGLAWDKLKAQEPLMQLHQADGNHAALAGSFLTALVFYQSITGNNAELLPYLSQIDLPQQQQQLLRQIAAATLQSNPACPFQG